MPSKQFRNDWTINDVPITELIDLLIDVKRDNFHSCDVEDECTCCKAKELLTRLGIEE